MDNQAFGTCSFCGNATPECGCRVEAVEAVRNFFLGSKRSDSKLFSTGVEVRNRLAKRFSEAEWADIHEEAFESIAKERSK